MRLFGGKDIYTASGASVVVLAILYSLMPAAVSADEFTSPSFTVDNPVITSGGEYSSSPGFQLFSSIFQLSIGESDTGSFTVRSGFLYFPEPTAAPSPPPTGGGPGGGGIFHGIIQQVIEAALAPCPNTLDLNCDGAVDIRDLSIFFFLTPEPVPNRADFNQDNRVNLRDLSLLFSGWSRELLPFTPERSELVAAEEFKLPSRETAGISQAVLTSETRQPEPKEIGGPEKRSFADFMNFVLRIIAWSFNWIERLFKGIFIAGISDARSLK